MIQDGNLLEIPENLLFCENTFSKNILSPQKYSKGSFTSDRHRKIEISFSQRLSHLKIWFNEC